MKLAFAKLSEPFEESQIERTKAAVTRKGYDTTGIKYQYIVNRLNELHGVGCFRTEQTFSSREFTRGAQNRIAYEVTCQITLELGSWVEGVFCPQAQVFGVGGHQSNSLADAHKGAYTNGFKKAAAMLGVGKQAYEGTIDDDNVPNDFSLNEQKTTVTMKAGKDGVARGTMPESEKSFF